MLANEPASGEWWPRDTQEMDEDAVSVHAMILARPSLRPGFSRRREAREEKVDLRVLRGFACEFFLGETLPPKFDLLARSL
jgi:hypothetical protein